MLQWYETYSIDAALTRSARGEHRPHSLCERAGIRYVVWNAMLQRMRQERIES